jgi:hypothetical protein
MHQHTTVYLLPAVDLLSTTALLVLPVKRVGMETSERRRLVTHVYRSPAGELRGHALAGRYDTRRRRARRRRPPQHNTSQYPARGSRREDAAYSTLSPIRPIRPNTSIFFRYTILSVDIF